MEKVSRQVKRDETDVASRAAEAAHVQGAARLSLLDYLPVVMRGHECPQWLWPVAEMLERSEVTAERWLVSVPPRHGTSTLLMAAIGRRTLRWPTTRIAYATGGNVGRFFVRELGRPSVYGIDMTETSPVCGKAFDLLIVDQPYRSREEALRQETRDRVLDYMRSSLLCRLVPSASAIVIHPHYHEDDLIERLASVQGGGWGRVNIPPKPENAP